MYPQLTFGIFRYEFRSRYLKNERRDFDLFAYEVIIPEDQTYHSSVHSELKWFSIDELQNIPMVPSDALFSPELRKFYRL